MESKGGMRVDFKPYITMALPVVILRLSDDADKKFMTDLFIAYRYDMYDAAIKVVNDHQIAEDMVQEACAAIIDKIEQVRKIESNRLKAYVVAIVRNRSINYVVKSNRRSKYSFLTGDIEALAQRNNRTEDDEELVRMFNVLALKRAVQTLSEREQSLLRMRYVDELSSAEIAEIFDVEPGSIRFYLTQVRRKLAERLKEDSESGS